MGFSRLEYQSGLPFPPPGDLPNSEMELASLASPALAGGFFITAPPGKALFAIWACKYTLGFVGHIISAATSQICHYIAEASIVDTM